MHGITLNFVLTEEHKDIFLPADFQCGRVGNKKRTSRWKLTLRFAFLERRDVIVWRLENGGVAVLYMVLDFQIMAFRNSEECFVCDGLRGRRHDMTSLRVLEIPLGISS